MNAAPVVRKHTGPRAATLLLIALLVALAAIPLAALWQAFGPKPSLAPDFTLTDQDGRPFTLSGLRGNPVVLFFGYTHCPDTCPTTLAHLEHAVHSPGVSPDVRVAFVTVDPARDSPATLKRYVRLFDPRFIGLTGSMSALAPVYSAYHTWREEFPVNHGPHEYSVAHGAAITYIARDGTLAGFGSWDDEMPAMINDLKELQ